MNVEKTGDGYNLKGDFGTYRVLKRPDRPLWAFSGDCPKALMGSFSTLDMAVKAARAYEDGRHALMNPLVSEAPEDLDVLTLLDDPDYKYGLPPMPDKTLTAEQALARLRYKLGETVRYKLGETDEEA